jgi:S1-C subfamily serine protease
MAAEGSSNPLVALSAALAALVAAAMPRAIGVRAKGAPPLSGTLWRADVVVASEQVFPDVGEAEILHPDGAMSRARVAGRDPGTNVVALRLDTSVEIAPPASAEPSHGGLALVLSAGLGGPQARLGLVSRLGPAWVSRAGGQIDRHIGLDLLIGTRSEGGPVFDAAGGLLGMVTAGPDTRGLVIPAATIDRVIGPLLATGRVARGWLGLGMQPIALDDDLATQSGHRRGLMVMQVAPGGPAAGAGLIPGDIIVELAGTPVGRLRRIAQLLGPDSVGRGIELGLIRAGAPLRVTLTIGERPDKSRAENPAS